jgi:thiamine pyrophosphate-dependent acetolactate synthase large subunit-like protein
MNKTAAIRVIIGASGTKPVIFTTGSTCSIAREIADLPNHFYMTGPLGLASSVGIGVALETKRTTVVVDGDGSLLMNPTGLITAGTLTSLPLVHVVLDDGIYAFTGGEQVPSRRADLCALARASGYRQVFSTARLDELSALLHSQLASCSSPVFIRCALVGGDTAAPGRMAVNLEEHARRFYGHITDPVWLARAA